MSTIEILAIAYIAMTAAFMLWRIYFDRYVEDRVYREAKEAIDDERENSRHVKKICDHNEVVALAWRRVAQETLGVEEAQKRFHALGDK